MSLLREIREGDAGKAQFVRFIINGCLSAAIHYGVYLALILVIDHYLIYIGEALTKGTATSIAYAIGYIVSFAFNFYFTCRFTFRAAPTLRRFVGFSGSHAVNFLLHIVLFSACMYVGMHRLIAPVVVMGIAMLVQFTILRLVFRQHPATPSSPEAGE